MAGRRGLSVRGPGGRNNVVSERLADETPRSAARVEEHTLAGMNACIRAASLSVTTFRT
jgi:hypothetical protein